MSEPAILTRRVQHLPDVFKRTLVPISFPHIAACAVAEPDLGSGRVLFGLTDETAQPMPAPPNDVEGRKRCNGPRGTCRPADGTRHMGVYPANPPSRPPLPL